MADDLDAAVKESASTGRPVFIQFQEVPGCATCKGFGRAVLSHPLLVEAIESEFVPIAIHNNRPGRDADVLQRLSEQSLVRHATAELTVNGYARPYRAPRGSRREGRRQLPEHSRSTTGNGGRAKGLRDNK